MAICQKKNWPIFYSFYFFFFLRFQHYLGDNKGKFIIFLEDWHFPVKMEILKNLEVLYCYLKISETICFSTTEIEVFCV